ncbi:MAG: hypothetical protein IJ829_08130, partial [Kiritimatiellae bacterium]|nr:hypothetical protein [Kiritimatiellia bacterium]
MRGRCLAAAALAFAAAFAGAGEVTSLPVPPEYAAAPRGFREFDLRDWRFAKDDGALERSPRDVGALEWREVSIPHDWAIEGPFDPAGDGDTGKLPWKGAAWYSTRLPPHFVGYIVFEGVMARSRVFLGGEERGGSDYGYLGFSFPVEKADAARELLVRVDTFAHESRWYPGAGVYRPVRAIWAEGETVAPDSLKIVAESLAPEKATVAVSFDTNSRTGLSFRVEIESPRLWDVDDPHLYEIEVLGRRFRFGLRSAAFTADGGFFLNGRRVELRGACLHADLGILGMAFSKSAARRQLEILKDAGFNAVRTAHNCPAPGLLDLCDEMGLLVWDECFDKWDAKAGRASGQNLEEYVAHYLGLFARRDRNHPCVVAWSIGNEIDRASEKRPDGTTRARCRLFREAVRAEDATRPVAIASCEWFAGLAEGGDYDDLDVVGMNYMGRYAYYHERRPLVPVVESESASCVATQGF